MRQTADSCSMPFVLLNLESITYLHTGVLVLGVLRHSFPFQLKSIVEVTALKLAIGGWKKEIGTTHRAPIMAHFKFPLSLPMFPMFHTAAKKPTVIPVIILHIHTYIEVDMPNF